VFDGLFKTLIAEVGFPEVVVGDDESEIRLSVVEDQ